MHHTLCSGKKAKSKCHHHVFCRVCSPASKLSKLPNIGMRYSLWSGAKPECLNDGFCRFCTSGLCLKQTSNVVVVAIIPVGWLPSYLYVRTECAHSVELTIPERAIRGSTLPFPIQCSTQAMLDMSCTRHRAVH